MTRDEAIELRLKHIGAYTKAVMPAGALVDIVANEIDFYLAAGMLNLDDDGLLRYGNRLNGATDEIERLLDFVSWVDTWVSNPASAYSLSAIDGLFGMARDRISALARYRE